MSDTNVAIPVILDCDPGHDDAIAILLAVQSPRIDLRAVTTTFGNCSVADATRNALRILTLAGVTTTPVARGAAASLAGTSELGNYVHGASGIDGPDLPEPAFTPSELSAVALIRQVLDASDRPVTIVATGPITNVAALLQQHPDARHQIAEIIFMGGSTERGNHIPTAEFNTYADPEALEVVLSSGLPVKMVGLNLSTRHWPRRRSSPGCGPWTTRSGGSARSGWASSVPPTVPSGISSPTGPRPVYGRRSHRPGPHHVAGLLRRRRNPR